jgi:hypothetical protein
MATISKKCFLETNGEDRTGNAYYEKQSLRRPENKRRASNSAYKEEEQGTMHYL